MPENEEFDHLGFQQRLAELEAARTRARQILEVAEGADDAALRAAYRQKAKLLHPDRAQGSPDAHRQFLLLRAAYDLLAHGKLDPILTEAEPQEDEQPHSKYNLDSKWGHFLWWRDRFFAP